ncbi:sigma 54-interacting transcriptional regulator [Candidatus Manganitrophus noduliformans]|uniref:FHA domain-containing protein n=1 Tax=Candidatus Manganitrophus noduliformans TaxID=2606439 RepID=A0A7X6I9F9_9BACT|nr:sigma 54-interacting transcriptional regulator [Candidatus Manganitrophus noduliformans]NKE69294.1 FHA domain-containing protein [Candidatus Manganitrophus noduliformans]
MLELKIFQDKKLIQKVVLSKREITVGRSADNDLILPDEHVSRLHAIIARRGEEFLLEDRSSNGVFVNGKKVSGVAPLAPRCRVEIYPFELECFYEGEEETAPLSHRRSGEKRGGEAPSPAFSPPSSALIYHFGILIGESPPMQQIYQMIQDVAKSTATVLIRGEHGTGKELVARAIHEASPRRQKPFLPVNAAAIPLELIESELFGYEKGTFTGAQTAKKGKTEEADGGTLFLDEIGELSPAAQAKLLRFLQGKKINRLGSAYEIPVDVRVIAATNKDLERAVEEEVFRPDLYYRLKVAEIFLPPLRERPEDIPLLAAHFLQAFSQELGLPACPLLTPEARHRLQRAPWPGNTRQLENFIYGALIRARPPYSLDEAALFSSAAWPGQSLEEFQSPAETAPLQESMRQLLLRTLEAHEWNAIKAAKVLKVSRGTIYYKMKKYGIQIPGLSKKDESPLKDGTIPS